MPPRSQTTDLDLVLRALGDVETYPADGHTQASRNTLIAGLPLALTHPPGEEPHEFQKGLVRLAEAVLSSARAAAAKALAASEEEVKAAEGRSDQAQIAACEAAEVVPVRGEEREAKVAALREVEAEVASAEKYFKGLEAAKDEVLAERAVVKGKRDAAEAALLALEKLGTEEAQEKDAARVAAYLQEVGAEEAVVAAAPHALGLRPSKRRCFDNATIEEISGVLTRASAEARERVEEGVDTEAYAEAEALGAWAILDLARERKQVASMQFNQARRAVKSAEDAEAAAQATIEACRRAMSSSLVEQTLMEAKIKELDGAMAALARCAQAPAVEGSADTATTAEDAGSIPTEEATCTSTEMKVDALSACSIPDPARSGA